MTDATKENEQDAALADKAQLAGCYPVHQRDAS